MLPRRRESAVMTDDQTPPSKPAKLTADLEKIPEGMEGWVFKLRSRRNRKAQEVGCQLTVSETVSGSPAKVMKSSTQVKPK
jgi:hypothetical protein